ncbi:hypothetical protein [Lactococcus garvieae]|uniref:hypothetical protein n=1 Tax=Lactococcus garvieae TaxID=1363 RepID=UPI002550B2F2|nr:hypothetical protein [Lactococcus garvieae]
MARGLIDIKKHCATKQCSTYDVMVYRNSKVYPYVGQLYLKIGFEEVKRLILKEKLRPTVLSQALFEKNFT